MRSKKMTPSNSTGRDDPRDQPADPALNALAKGKA